MKSKPKKSSSKSKNSAPIWFITGPMFSNKTHKLLTQIRFFLKKSKKILVFKSKIDTRNAKGVIFSRSGGTFPAIPVANEEEIWKVFSAQTVQPDLVFINEINFFSPKLIPVMERIAAQKTRIICDGLLKDYQNNYFPISQLLEKSARTFYRSASCVKCFAPAACSQRLNKNKSLLLIGDKKTYEARCTKCYV